MANLNPHLNFRIGSTKTLFSLPSSLICSHSAYIRHRVFLTNHKFFNFPNGNPDTFNDLVDWLNKSGPVPQTAPLGITATDFTADKSWRLIYLYVLCEQFQIPLLQNQVINVITEGSIKYRIPFLPAQIDHIFDDKQSKPTSPLRRLAAKLTAFFWRLGKVDRKVYERCIRYDAFREAVEVALKEFGEGGTFEVYTWMDSLCAFHHHEDGEKCEGLNVIPIGKSVGNYEAPPLPRNRAEKEYYKIPQLKKSSDPDCSWQRNNDEDDERGRWPWAWWDQ
ncbi:MAG: hypothetical protein M1836_007451 [Candelina mexicana]|nr:MAG: hypothetical protein M1836_007451 [Candelina mexicana]